MCINRERGVERLHSSFLFGKREEDDDDDDFDDDDDDDNTGSTKAIITPFVFFESCVVSTQKHINRERRHQKSIVF